REHQRRQRHGHDRAIGHAPPSCNDRLHPTRASAVATFFSLLVLDRAVRFPRHYLDSPIPLYFGGHFLPLAHARGRGAGRIPPAAPSLGPVARQQVRPASSQTVGLRATGIRWRYRPNFLASVLLARGPTYVGAPNSLRAACAGYGRAGLVDAPGT